MRIPLARFLAVASFVAVLHAGESRAADPRNGEEDFKQCAACHATDQSTRVGPGLFGIVGRHAGAVPGFRYSRAMKNATLVWDEAALDAFLANPQAKVPGTVMPFSGVADAAERADLIAYLATLK